MAAERDGAVLVSSAGRRVALVRAFQSASRSLGCTRPVIACDASDTAAALYVADDRRLVPRVTSSDFVDQLLGICREESVRLLVPTIDPELPVLAEAAEAFGAVGTHVLVPAKEATAVAADKRLTNGFLRAHGIGTVEQWSPKQAADIPFGDGRSFVAKPAGGSAGHGVMLLDGASRPLDLPADYVVEEFAPGREHTVDVYVDRYGQCVCVTPRERLEVRAGEVSKGITREVPLLDAAVRHLVSSLGLKGCVVAVQAFWDPSDNQLRIIEVNARFGGGFPLTLEAGANFPEWLLREYIFGERLTPFDAWRRNLLMSRYDDAVYVQK